MAEYLDRAVIRELAQALTSHSGPAGLLAAATLDLLTELDRQAAEIARLQVSDRRWQEVQYVHTDRINELSALVAHLRAIEAAARELCDAWKEAARYQAEGADDRAAALMDARWRLVAALAPPAAAADAEPEQFS